MGVGVAAALTSANHTNSTLATILTIYLQLSRGSGCSVSKDAAVATILTIPTVSNDFLPGAVKPQWSAPLDPFSQLRTVGILAGQRRHRNNIKKTYLR